MTEKKANHQANIVTVREVLPHNNADNLEIVPVGEYQVVSRKGQFKIGDLAVYIQPDSVVPQTEAFSFIWSQYMCEPTEPGTTFQVPEKRRRITVRKFRGEWSEGLLLPVTDFWTHGIIGPNGQLRKYLPVEGEDVSDELGITHYDPDAGKFETGGESGHAPRLTKKYPKTLKGWYKWFIRKINSLFRKGPLDGKHDSISLGIPTYDVDALKNYPNTFVEGEKVIVTEKIHGSNARYIYLDGKQYAGSRNLWKSEDSNCIFRRVLNTQPWIGEWCKAHEGYVLWGEITPTQSKYEYGSTEPQFFVFDIRKPDGTWADESDPEPAQLMDHSVPVLYIGPYNLEEVQKYVDGISNVPGAKNIREGVVIKTAKERHQRGVGRCQLKVVSNAFLEKDNK